MTHKGMSRRELLGAAIAPLFVSGLTREIAAADIPQHIQALIVEATGGVTPSRGKVKLTLPAIAESGNSVPLKLQVDSPMTAESYVRSIHIFSARNPRPVIARFHLGPQSGRAEVNTRIRLAGTQEVFALAIMSDASAWLGSTGVVVTAAACTDEKQEQQRNDPTPRT
ncbi:MAG: sulfur oxidation protein SoxY [Deltaproteobacteria bacterium]|nr:sulfur oxidation protein SoxY [Deltaproteobacteria bacterium]